MKKALKWTGIVLGSLILIIMVVALYLSNKFNSEFEQTYTIEPAPVAIPTDSASIARGRILSVGCANCHDNDLAGKLFFDDPSLGKVASPNLTRAAGSETEGYTDVDFVGAIRHGLNKKGNPLMVMPSESYANFSDEDLGSLIAFLKTLQPIERSFEKRQLTFMAQVMAGAGLFGNMNAYSKINHEVVKNISAPPISNSIEYGRYVTRWDGCIVCHGENFGGGKSPDPISPPVPDVTKSGNIGKWTLEQFVATFRTGKTPEGKVLDAKFMPFSSVGALSDIEIEAVYNYLQSLPPANPNGGKTASN
jgi:cytochrome c553